MMAEQVSILREEVGSLHQPYSYGDCHENVLAGGAKRNAINYRAPSLFRVHAMVLFLMLKHSLT